ncbi:MAG: acetamidase/formamidase family protein, partial [Gammaproteobacteria bacterium]|nr:acetamidase/formamidase family protein [Gammaproteobacteria bacterium]
MEMISRKYPNNWVENSIMYKRGVGKGSSGVTHHLTEDVQGTYIYTMGPYSDPVMTIKPGDQVVVETRDAFEGAIKSEQDKPSEILKMPFLNPQAGPIMIEGAEPGDAVAVHIETMLPR